MLGTRQLVNNQFLCVSDLKAVKVQLLLKEPSETLWEVRSLSRVPPLCTVVSIPGHFSMGFSEDMITVLAFGVDYGKELLHIPIVRHTLDRGGDQ